MHVSGELHCMSCGYVAGDVDVDQRQAVWAGRITRAANGPGIMQQQGERPRCGRCGGRLLLEPREEIFRSAAGSLRVKALRGRDEHLIEALVQSSQPSPV